MKTIGFLITFALLVGSAYGDEILIKAYAKLHANGDGEWIGTIGFTQLNSKFTIHGKVRALPPGLHGFHAHMNGNLANNCTAAGDHFNPHGKEHGAPDDPVRHVGDFGNIVASEDGKALIHKTDALARLSGVNSIAGRAVVIHAKPDDLGLGSDPESKKTGNAGSRLACGIVHVFDRERIISIDEFVVFP